MVDKNWREEKQAAYLYHLIAQRETDPVREKMFLELADAAEKQASIWALQLPEKEQVTLVYQPDLRTRLVGKLIHLFNAKNIRTILSAMKVRGMSIYSEAAHATTSHLEYRHKGLNAAGSLRAAVFGINDGLLSNMSLVLGVIGASANHHFIIVSGVTGLLAGACSMAAGEYVSMCSQQEFFAYQIELEREELELYPEEEAAELACIYRARGLSVEEAKHMAKTVISHPTKALDALAREELGLNPEELGSPFAAAGASFFAFAAGASIPLLPFIIPLSANPIRCSLILTSACLFLLGSALSLFTNRNALLSGLRMLLIGGMAGSITFLIGKSFF